MSWSLQHGLPLWRTKKKWTAQGSRVEVIRPRKHLSARSFTAERRTTWSIPFRWTAALTPIDKATPSDSQTRSNIELGVGSLSLRGDALHGDRDLNLGYGHLSIFLRGETEHSQPLSLPLVPARFVLSTHLRSFR
jgi:hypothetical protein